MVRASGQPCETGFASSTVDGSEASDRFTLMAGECLPGTGHARCAASPYARANSVTE
ncbi:hypothetical protein XACS582_14250005 [Xanthomonas citri pv. citri]|nr:hypothetical protein XAC3824_1490002 [Xanthomonas citri pv. citri]CEE27914.1 hypothetical protein XAC902_1710036 [Xanthomonas citri pv. citri]CEE28246.1 hypothetical protein XAC2911_1450019 [Xanthomonas citri pv. citri]CEE51721.1 hypothetical protein XAC71A_1350002 [Xanthomonas citri pv. citri]CEE55300.1 hypothetical protein XACS584_1380001 [Xanthomonas citri pv. citri]